MAMKAKVKPKAAKKAAKRSAAARKSIGLKAKAERFASRNGSRSPGKSPKGRVPKRTARLGSDRTSVASAIAGTRSTAPPRPRSKHFANAVHVLYALAAANAVQGDRDNALHHLKQAIHFRPENRFLAARDSDFQSLQEDPDFKQLVTATEK